MPRTLRQKSTVLRAIPPELICKIMLHSLPLVPSPDSMRIPLTWSHICKRWRACSFSNPALWTTIYHCSTDITCSDTQGIFVANNEIIKHFIDHSAPYSLNIVLYLAKEGDFLLLNPIFVVMERWKSIQLDVRECEGITLPAYFYLKDGDEEIMNDAIRNRSKVVDDDEDADSDYIPSSSEDEDKDDDEEEEADDDDDDGEDEDDNDDDDAEEVEDVRREDGRSTCPDPVEARMSESAGLDTYSEEVSDTSTDTDVYEYASVLSQEWGYPTDDFDAESDILYLEDMAFYTPNPKGVLESSLTPLLEHLDLRCSDSLPDLWALPRLMAHIANGSQRLTRLHWRSPFAELLLPSRYATLRSFEALAFLTTESHPDVDQVPLLLDRAPNLDSLTVKNWTVSFARNLDNPLEYPRPPCAYHTLRHLDLTWDAPDIGELVFPVLLGFLTLPRLEILRLYTDAWIDDEVIALLERSDCRLKKLVLLDNAAPRTNSALRFPSLTKLLKRGELLSFLEELVVDYSAFDNETVDLLIIAAPDEQASTPPPIPFPALRRIRLIEGLAYQPSQLGPDHLTRLLKSRFLHAGVKMELSFGEWHWGAQTPVPDLRDLYAAHRADCFTFTCDNIPGLEDLLWMDEATGAPLRLEEMVPRSQAELYRQRLLSRVAELEEGVRELKGAVGTATAAFADGFKRLQGLAGVVGAAQAT